MLQLEARLEGQFLREWEFAEMFDEDPAMLDALMQMQDPIRIHGDQFKAHKEGEQAILYGLYRAVSLLNI